MSTPAHGLIYGIRPFYYLNEEKQQRDTIKTSLLSLMLIYLLNLFLNSALLFLWLQNL